MRDGVIANFELTENMLRYFIRAVHDDRRTLVRPRMIIGVPSGITQVERRAVKDSALRPVRVEVHTIMEPMAAAIGAGLPVHEDQGIWLLILVEELQKLPLLVKRCSFLSFSTYWWRRDGSCNYSVCKA